MTLASGDSLGRYTIERRLGSGAMGEVHLARDPRIDRPVALKTLRLAADGTGRTVRPGEAAAMSERLLREARAAGRLIHPHIVTLFDAGEDDGLLYLAFEYVAGSDLAVRLGAPPPLALGEALRIAGEACAGLDHAHRHGIVHRDVKPSNLMLTGDGRVKISDFGIAKLAGEAHELTVSGTLMGSPYYLSPEQVRGEPLDGRSDLFSLGIVLYEMLAGRRPFAGETLTTLVYQILHTEPPALPPLRAGLAPAVPQLLAWFLAKDRELRVPDARTAGEAVAGLAASLPRELLALPAAADEEGTLLLDASAAGSLRTLPPPPGAGSAGGGGFGGAEGRLPPPPPPAAGAASPPAAGAAPGGGAGEGVAAGDGVPAGGAAAASQAEVSAPPAPAAVAGAEDASWSGGPPQVPPQVPAAVAAAAAEAVSAAGSASPAVASAAAAGPVFSGSYAVPRGRPGRGARRAALAAAVVVLAGLAVALFLLRPAGETATPSLASPATGTGLPPVDGSPGGGEAAGLPEAAGAGAGEPQSAVARDAAGSAPGPGSPADGGRPQGAPADPRATADRAASAAPAGQPVAPPASVPLSPPGRIAAEVAEGSPAARRDHLPPAASPGQPSDLAGGAPSAAPGEAAGEAAAAGGPGRRPRGVGAAEAFDETITSGMGLVLRIVPDDAYVLVDGTVVGQAREFSPAARRPLALPSPGEHTIVLRRAGMRDRTIRVVARADGPAVTPLVGRLLPAAAAETPLHELERHRVGKAIGLRVTPAEARVLVDGRLVGVASDFAGGRLGRGGWLELPPGMHRVSLVAPGHRQVDLAIDVTSGALEERKRIQVTLPPLPAAAQP